MQVCHCCGGLQTATVRSRSTDGALKCAATRATALRHQLLALAEQEVVGHARYVIADYAVAGFAGR